MTSSCSVSWPLQSYQDPKLYRETCPSGVWKLGLPMIDLRLKLFTPSHLD